VACAAWHSTIVAGLPIAAAAVHFFDLSQGHKEAKVDSTAPHLDNQFSIF
jgi:hypothetical protein